MEGDEDRSLVCVLNAISIHSLRMEGDPSPTWEASKPMPFQSTPSAWRETVLQVVGQSTGHHFNPLPPHGGRPENSKNFSNHPTFQSTPSAWRETSVPEYRMRRIPPFQSTPSAWRETYSYSIYKVHQLFQSTPSAWRETSVSTPAALPSVISIHSLRMEGDVRILK